MNSHSIDKKTLREPDLFHKLSLQAWSWIQANRTPVVTAISIIVALSVISIAVSVVRGRQNREALNKLEEVYDDYNRFIEAGRPSGAPEAKVDVEKLKTQLLAVAKDFPSVSAGALANQFLGEIAYREKRFADAIPYFETYLKTLPAGSPLAPLIRSSLAYSYEGAGKWNEALGQMKLAAEYKESPGRADFLFNTARLYEKVNNQADAKATYEKFLKEFPDSNLGPLAKARLAVLGETKKP